MFCWSDPSPADLRDILDSIGILPPACLAVSLMTGFSRNRNVQQETGTEPLALSRWIGPGQWRLGPLQGVSIRCCLGV
jgi:hypothetical protein